MCNDAPSTTLLTNHSSPQNSTQNLSNQMALSLPPTKPLVSRDVKQNTLNTSCQIPNQFIKPNDNSNDSNLINDDKSKPLSTQRRPSCEGCARPHDGSYGSGRFCSVHCARRVAASRKWEKQRTQQKRQASLTKTVTASFPDNSSSTLSSASSRDIIPTNNQQICNKRRRVIMMNIPPTTHQPIQPTHSLPNHTVYSLHPLHQIHLPSSANPQSNHPSTQVCTDSNLIHPQPQSYQRNQTSYVMPSYSSTQPTVSTATTSLNTTPNPTPPPISSFLDYSHVPPRAVSPFTYSQASSYYSYPQTTSVTPSNVPQTIVREQPPTYPHVLPYSSPSPQYSVYPSSTPNQSHQPPSLWHQMPPPPPPPTPAPGTLGRHPNQIANNTHPAIPTYPRHIATSNDAISSVPDITPQSIVSTKKECEAVAEALLSMRTNNKE